MSIALHQVILRPVLSEKTNSIGENVYAFIVHKNADKLQIRKAVETLFSVKVAFVNTLNYRPVERFFGRKKGVQKAYKKAYVRLSSGSIDFSSL